MIVFSICWFLLQVLEAVQAEDHRPDHRRASLYGLFVYPLYQLGKFFYVPGRLDKVKKPRMYASIAGGLAILGDLLPTVPPSHPVPSGNPGPRRRAGLRRRCPASSKSIDVRPGEHVTAGKMLAQLSSKELELDSTSSRPSTTRRRCS